MENHRLKLKMRNFIILYFTLSFCILVFTFSTSAYAATAIVSVDTGAEDINALEATLVLSEGVHVSRIETGNSAVLFWIEAPKLTGNTITFSGITPGGFSGAYPIFAVSGNFSADDLEQMRFESVNALKNDGSGTSVTVELAFSLVGPREDRDPPEDFMPTISSDPAVFEGRYFLVFATQDKGSGVSRYEAREGRWRRFRIAESPYLLKSQKLDRDIYVKAIDNAGNERTVILPSRVHRNWWDGARLFAILIVVVAAILYIKSWARFTR